MVYKVVLSKFLLVIILLFETLGFLKINKRGKYEKNHFNVICF